MRSVVCGPGPGAWRKRARRGISFRGPVLTCENELASTGPESSGNHCISLNMREKFNLLIGRKQECEVISKSQEQRFDHQERFRSYACF